MGNFSTVALCLCIDVHLSDDGHECFKKNVRLFIKMFEIFCFALTPFLTIFILQKLMLICQI